MKTESARAIVCKNNSVLLLFEKESNHEHYVLPGGKREENETLEETVIREVLEETSIVVTSPKLIETVTYTAGNTERVLHIFDCTDVSGEPVLGESPEKEKMKTDPNFFAKPVWIPILETNGLEITPKATIDVFTRTILGLFKK